MPVNLPILRINHHRYPVEGRACLLGLVDITKGVFRLGFIFFIAVWLADSSNVSPALARFLSAPPGQQSVPGGSVKILNPMEVVGHGTLNDLEWSMDGSQLAIASSLGLYFYDSLNLREINHVDMDVWITQLHFNRRANQLATMDRGGGITLWNMYDHPYPISHTGLSGGVNLAIGMLAFRDDLSILAVARGPTSLQLFDLEQGRTIAWINLPDYPDTRQIETLAFSPDGKELAVDVGYNIYLIDASSGVIQRILPGDHDVHHLAFSPAGPWLAVDNAIFNLHNGTRQQVFRSFSPANIGALTYSPDGQVLAITTGSKVSLVDITSGRVLQELIANGTNIRFLRFNPDGRKVAAATDDDRLWIWEVITGDILQTKDDFTGPVLDVGFSPDGSRFAAITNDHIWVGDAQQSRVQETLPSPAGALTHLAFNPNIPMLATAGDWLRLWNTNATILHRELVGHTARVNVIAFSPDGRFLATAGSDHTVRIWRTDTPIWVNGNDFNRTSIADLPYNMDFLAFSPDGSRLAGGSRTSSLVYIWDSRNGLLRFTLNGPVGGLTSLRFSPDSSLLAVSGVGYRRTNNPVTPFRRSSAAYIWSVNSGKLVANLGALGSSAHLVRFTLDGHMMLCDCLGDTQLLGLWQVSSSEENSANRLKALPPIQPDGSEDVTGVVFSPDSKLAAIALAGGRIEIWNTKNRDFLYNLSGHLGIVNAMVFRPDSKMLLSGGQDGILIFWSLP